MQIDIFRTSQLHWYRHVGGLRGLFSGGPYCGLGKDDAMTLFVSLNAVEAG